MNVSIFTTFAAEEATGIGALGLDWKVMLLQAGTFVLLFFIFKKYALDKVVKVLDDRHNKIEESLKTADAIEKRSKETDKEAEKIISTARGEADQVVVKAHEEASEVIKDAEDTASKKQEKMIDEAQAKIEADVKNAKSELRGELLGLVADATETVLDEKVDTKTDQDLIKRSLEEATK